MKKRASVSLVCMALGAVALTLSGAQKHVVDESVAAHFVGAWRLVSLEAPGADGKIHKADAAGMFVFTRDGHAAVQVMERNAPAPAAGGEQYSQGGYEASFGTYEVDENAHTFVFHIDGALVRSLIGKDLPRSFEFSGNQLIVKSTRAEGHWRVTWERY